MIRITHKKDILNKLKQQLETNNVYIPGNSALITEMSKVFGVPPGLLEKKAPFETSTSQATSDAIAYINDYMRQYYRNGALTPVNPPYTRFCDELLDMLKNYGVHTDNLDKIRYVLDSEHGLPFIRSLTIEQVKDTEYLIQRLLELYGDITS